MLSGITGLALGVIAGWLWEQNHRRRRSRKRHAHTQSTPGKPSENTGTAAPSGNATTVAPTGAVDSPILRLVPESAPSLPDLSGKKLASIRFLADRIELDFSGILVVTTDSPVIVTGMQRSRYPDAGSRDALCSLIGASVEEMRAAPGERIELRFGADRQLIVPHPRARSVTIGMRT